MKSQQRKTNKIISLQEKLFAKIKEESDCLDVNKQKRISKEREVLWLSLTSAVNEYGWGTIKN